MLTSSLTSCKTVGAVLSSKEALILHLLVARPDCYGLELVSNSKGRLKRGTVYVTLGRLEDKGLITSKLDDEPAPTGGLPRRLYAPTATGRRVLRAYASVARHLKLEFAR